MFWSAIRFWTCRTNENRVQMERVLDEVTTALRVRGAL